MIKKYKKILLLVVICSGFLIWMLLGVIRVKCVLETQDTVGQIFVSIGQTLRFEDVENYDPVKSTCGLFPDIACLNGNILDAWGNKIKIEVIKRDKQIYVRVISSGGDGVFGTKDDIEREGILEEPSHGNLTMGNSSTRQL